MMSADEAAAKAAWFAKRGPAATRASHLAKQSQPATAPAAPAVPAAPAAPGASAPSWGTGMISMAGMCNGGIEYACVALSGEEAAKLAWLAAQGVVSPGSNAGAVLAAAGVAGGAAPVAEAAPPAPAPQSMGFQYNAPATPAPAPAPVVPAPVPAPVPVPVPVPVPRSVAEDPAAAAAKAAWLAGAVGAMEAKQAQPSSKATYWP